MKIAIILCLVAAASAGNLFEAPALYGAGVSSTGESAVQRQEDGIGNYAFSVSEQGATGGTTQQETGDVYGRKQGSYSLGVIDGRQRRVDWVADELGFRARVDTNEPGTVASNPADVLVNSPNAAVAHVGPVAAHPAAHVAAPIVQHAIQAPVAIPRPVVAAPAYRPIVQHAIPAPITKVVAPQVYAQPIVQQAIAVPKPVAFTSHVAHIGHAPLVKSIAQPIVQQAIGVAKPLYSAGLVSHAPITPYAGLGLARPYGYGLGAYGLGAYGLGLNGISAYGLGLNGLGYRGLGLAGLY